MSVICSWRKGQCDPEVGDLSDQKPYNMARDWLLKVFTK